MAITTLALAVTLLMFCSMPRHAMPWVSIDHHLGKTYTSPIPALVKHTLVVSSLILPFAAMICLSNFVLFPLTQGNCPSRDPSTLSLYLRLTLGP